MSDDELPPSVKALHFEIQKAIKGAIEGYGSITGPDVATDRVLRIIALSMTPNAVASPVTAGAPSPTPARRKYRVRPGWEPHNTIPVSSDPVAMELLSRDKYVVKDVMLELPRAARTMGVAASAIEQSHRRLARRGFVECRRVGRETFWRPTDAGKDELKKAIYGDSQQTSNVNIHSETV